MNFIAENEVEKRLLQAQNGEVSGEQFLQEMLKMKLFMPVWGKSLAADFAPVKQTKPLIIEDEDGIELVVLFSSPERAKGFVKAFPGYDKGLLAEFSLIKEKLGAGVGVILNPGYIVGLELEAEMLEQLVRN